MFKDAQYHELIRKTIVAFGTLFNDLYIYRRSSTGKINQKMKVPLAYGPKQKFLARIDQDSTRGADNVKTTALTLPRIGFELTGLTYDPARKLNRIQKFKKVKGADSKSLSNVYMPVPYNVSFTLFTMAKNSEDALQIVEQILPMFQPDYTVSLNVMPQLDIVRDVPIILNDVTYEDSYDGAFTERRVLMYTLAFTAKMYLYGPVTSTSVIKQVQVDQFTNTNTTTARREQRYVVTPNPTSADADDDFGFNETRSFFQDADDYDPSSGEDKQ
jgi:hypothetical protein|tara:strand:+ start:1061 stop:1876 length:816 start_codon:yes stop_codon:yes gene_type:complete